jgi:hypothetical protein
MTRPYHRVPTKTHNMSTPETTKEEVPTKEQMNYAFILMIAFRENTFPADLARMQAEASDEGKARAKKMERMYNLLKKTNDEGDYERFHAFLKTFIQHHLDIVNHVCIIGTYPLDLHGMMEHLEEGEYSDGLYLRWCDALKAIHDLRRLAGIKE